MHSSTVALLLGGVFGFQALVTASPTHHQAYHNQLKPACNDVDWSKGLDQKDWPQIEYDASSKASPQSDESIKIGRPPNNSEQIMQAPLPEPPTFAPEDASEESNLTKREPNAGPEAVPDTNASKISKRGIVYTWDSQSQNTFVSYKKISWAHNWGAVAPNLAQKYEFVPTLHDASDERTRDWAINVPKALAQSGTVHLMAFNEPDMLEQANLPPSTAVAAWRKHMKPYAGKRVRLASPSISNGAGINPKTRQPMGLDWLKPFLRQCKNCPISFVPVHWYGCTDGCTVDQDLQLFKRQMTDAMNTAVVKGKRVPVWLTEFQSFGDAQAFLAKALPWLDKQPQIERYSYFMIDDGILTQNNSPTALGLKYATF